MNQKFIGILLIILGLSVILLFLGLKSSNDAHIEMYVLESGSCFLEDGTCLHAENSIVYYVFGWIIGSILVIIGIMLIVSHEYNNRIEQNNKTILENIRKVREEENQKSSFEAFLKGFDDDEKRVLRIIWEQQGIKQNTLRLKSEISKAGLSLMLKSFEKKGILEKKPEGKTNRIFLKGYFGKELQ